MYILGTIAIKCFSGEGGLFLFSNIPCPSVLLGFTEDLLVSFSRHFVFRFPRVGLLFCLTWLKMYEIDPYFSLRFLYAAALSLLLCTCELQTKVLVFSHLYTIYGQPLLEL